MYNVAVEAENYYNKGTKYLNAKNYLKALSFFKKQLKTHSFKELHLNMGNAHRMLGEISLAGQHYTLACESSVPFADGSFGEYALGLNNLGLHIFASGDDVLSRALYLRALDLDPKYGEAYWNLGIATLRANNCNTREGWDLYEYRFDRGPGSVAIARDVPWWDFATTGDSIVVMTEQGLGDKIQFARYLPYLSGYFKEVSVVCDSSLDMFYSGYNCIRSVPADSLAVPLCSLPRAFGVVPETSGWLDNISAYKFDSGFNIGVVFTGSKTHSNDFNRSCPVYLAKKLAGLGRLYGLNPADPKLHGVTPLNPKTWAETVAYVKGLDVVVSVDTSIVHLAASLRKPVIMMQPKRETDFRWGNPFSGSQSWYSSLHIVQNPNNWETTVNNVREMLLHANNLT